MAKMSKWLGLAMAGALAFSLTACGGKADEGSASSGAGTGGDKAGTVKEKNVTITFQNIYPDPTDPKNKLMNKLVKQYESEHPNIKIELDSLNTDQQKLKLKTQAASKEVPDITVVNPAAQMQPFVEAKLLAPLDDMLDQNGLRGTFQDGLLDWYSFDGHTYAVPDGNNIGVVYYNKELFEKGGVQVPTTFEEMVDVVKTLKSKGIQPMAIGEKDTWTGSFLFMNMLLRTNNGPGFLKDVLDKKKTFEDPAFKEAVDAFQNLIQAGASRKASRLSTTTQAKTCSRPAKRPCTLWARGRREASKRLPSTEKSACSSSRRSTAKAIRTSSCWRRAARLRSPRTANIWRKRRRS
ncbi:Multiple sugar-binding protein precursor [Paenibacillus sp. P1XP2]|nr:Multiple sugar-binding protein precursor [Paenibacillus sp. P1XP2]